MPEVMPEYENARVGDIVPVCVDLVYQRYRQDFSWDTGWSPAGPADNEIGWSCSWFDHRNRSTYRAPRRLRITAPIIVRGKVGFRFWWGEFVRFLEPWYHPGSYGYDRYIACEYRIIWGPGGA